MRRLILLRHAKSDWPSGVADEDRPLARRGRRQAPLIGKYLADAGDRPALALVSPSRRTRETWDLAVTAFPQKIDMRIDDRLYEASASTILDVLRQTPPEIGTLLVVGHNPGVQALALALIGEATESDRWKLQTKYPTAAIAIIDFDCDEWSGLSEGSGRLDRFVTPKALAP